MPRCAASILSAVFGFALALALAVAARRPLAAALVAPRRRGLARDAGGTAARSRVGVVILLAVLVVLAGLTTPPRAARVRSPRRSRSRSRRSPPRRSSAVAKGGLVSLAALGLLHRAADARERLVRLGRAVRRHHVPEEADDRARDQGAAPVALLARRGARRVRRATAGIETLAARAADALEPPARKRRCCARTCTVARALRHPPRRRERAASASTPGDAPLVTRVPGIASLPTGLTRGFRYTVWSYAPQPTAAAARALAGRVYPVELTEPGTFLDVWPGVDVPPFGAPAQAASSTAARRAPGARPLRAARAGRAPVAGDAQTPYAAAVAARVVVPHARRLPLHEPSGRFGGARRSSASSSRRARATASTSPARWR